MSAVSFLLTMTGALLFYLASPNQGILKNRLPARLGILAAVTFEVAALGVWVVSLSPLAGFFAWLASLMLFLGLFPFLSLANRQVSP